MRRQEPELSVITKAYDLILWSCHHTARFPRNHRFVLGERIERNLYNVLELLVQARYTRERYDLYRAKMYALRPTTITRFRELERMKQGADARLRRAQEQHPPRSRD